jgi:hypothetical protein
MTRAFSLAAVSLVAALACSDHGAGTSPTEPYGPTLPSAPSIAEVTGIIVVDGAGAGDAYVHLMQQDGSLILLVGTEARTLASVAGGEVIVHGTWDANPGLVVSDFQVLSMGGRPALDGVIEMTDRGLALLLRDGSYVDLAECPAELSTIVGDRIWLTGSAANPPVQFGVIEAR